MKRACLVLLCVLVLAVVVWFWPMIRIRSNQPGGQPRSVIRQAASLPPDRLHDSPAQAAVFTGATQKDDSRERLGPFSVAGKDYSVLLQKKKRQPGSTQESGETVVAMEIQDASGVVEYQRTFPYQAQIQEFSDAWFVSAGILAGTNSSGLLVNYSLDSEPSAPEPEPTEWWQVFGVVNGRLRPFSGPISVQGGVVSSEELKTGYRTAGPLDAQSDALEFRVWAHHFRLIYPVRVDWTRGRLSPVQPCEKAMRAINVSCQFKVESEDLSNREDVTFVRFCPSPGQRCEKPERVLVKRDSRVEMVACQTAVVWSEGVTSRPSSDPDKPMNDEGGISVPEDDVWLRLRVDGKEGWVNSVEDFSVLSLPFEQ